MSEIIRSIEINAPVNDVFGYVSNYENWPAFYKGISDVKPISQTTAENGSKFIYKIRVLGMSFPVGTEFTDFTKNRGWTGKSFKGVEHQTIWKFIEMDKHTRFIHGVNYKLPWYYGGNLFDQFVMKSAWISTIEQSLNKLKIILESRPA